MSLGKNAFTEEDQNKVIDFLNMIAVNAKFNLGTKELIQYFGLLSHMQKVILPKIQGHILEVKAVKRAKENKE